MRAKQSTSQLTQSSFAQTILPSAANGRGRKSRGSEAPPPVPSAAPAPLQAPSEFAGAPAAPQQSAPAWSPPPPPAPAPDWGMSTSRFGSAPAAFGSAPADPRFGSAPAATYPVNYPAAPGFPPQPHYADSPVAEYVPPVAAGQWVPQHAAPHRGGTQTAPPGYGPPPFGAPGYQGYPPMAAPGRSTAAKVLIALAIAVVGMIGISILAAIAIPVFLSQRDKPAARNVVLPATLVDQQRLDSTDFQGDLSREIASVQKAVPGVTQTAAAYYGQGGQPLFGVAAGKLPNRPTSAEEKEFFGATARVNEMAFTPVASGPFGGQMQCGQTPSGTGALMTVCASLDDAAVFVIAALGTSPSDLAIVTRQVIGAVEQKS